MAATTKKAFRGRIPFLLAATWVSKTRFGIALSLVAQRDPDLFDAIPKYPPVSASWQMMRQWVVDTKRIWSPL